MNQVKEGCNKKFIAINKKYKKIASIQYISLSLLKQYRICICEPHIFAHFQWIIKENPMKIYDALYLFHLDYDYSYSKDLLIYFVGAPVAFYPLATTFSGDFSGSKES